MPTYLYNCLEHGEFDVIKSMGRATETETCSCGKVAEKIITLPQISPSAKAFEPHFNYGLGKEVLRRQDVREELARIKGETGKEIVEVGSDTLQSVKKKFKGYDLTHDDIARAKATVGA